MTKRQIEYWVIPPEADAEFAANMENVLEVYAKPYDPRHPVVCMDELSKQLIGEIAMLALAIVLLRLMPQRITGRSTQCHDPQASSKVTGSERTKSEISVSSATPSHSIQHCCTGKA